MSVSPPSSESEPKFRVAICGAGIAGLVLAITIAKFDSSIPIDLYEARDSVDTAGVGISVWRQTHEVMMELGLFDELKQIFSHKPGTKHGPNMRRSDIRDGGYHWFHIIHRYGLSSMHRQQMVAILERHLPASSKFHSGKRLVNYVEQDSTSTIRLDFADGTTATTDVLVGADGIRSAVRKSMFELASDESGTDLKSFIDPTFSGHIIYRCLLPAEVLRKESPENQSLKVMTGYTGKGRYLVTYPIVNGTLVNVAASVYEPSLIDTPYEERWVSDATSDEIVGHYDDFEPDARAILKACENPTKWALHVVKPLPFWVRKKVVLAGDACHAMPPHFGAGGGQAIEDAFVLGRLLAHPLVTLSGVPRALHIYQEVRLPFAQTIASLSLSTACMYSFMAPGFYDGARKDDLDENGISEHEKKGMESLKEEILRRWEFVEEATGALHGWKEAEAKLQAALASAVH